MDFNAAKMIVFVTLAVCIGGEFSLGIINKIHVGMQQKTHNMTPYCPSKLVMNNSTEVYGTVKILYWCLHVPASHVLLLSAGSPHSLEETEAAGRETGKNKHVCFLSHSSNSSDIKAEALRPAQRGLLVFWGTGLV